MIRHAVAIGTIITLAWVVACGAPPPKPEPEARPEPKPELKIDPSTTNLTVAAPNPEVRTMLFAEFRPVALANCKFERVGGEGDGGYVVCGNLLKRATSVYSYGIAHTDQWGCEVSGRLGAPVHQYDCFDTQPPVCSGGKAVFHEECVAPKRYTEDGRLFDSVAAQVARNGDTGKRLVVKMDVEGAEWASLLATPDELLAQIDQLVVEFHRVDHPLNVEAIRKLKGLFHIANIHYNNYACDPAVEPFPSWAFQVLLVNKALGVPAPAGTVVRLPNPLDQPDDPNRQDCQPKPAVTESKSRR